MQEKHVALYYKEGNSDKEYHVHLVRHGTGFKVNIEYGRRGASLTVVTKTDKSVSLDEANKLFDSLVHTKKLRGYTEAAGKTPYVGSDKESKITGVLPQLLNRIDDATLEKVLSDESFIMQEKKDGKRILLRRKDGVVEAINRKGLLVGFPDPIAKSAEQIKGNFIIDGEMVGDVYYAFDTLELNNTNVGILGYSERYEHLKNEFSALVSKNDAIRLVETAFTEKEKRATFTSLRNAGVEGVVFKKKDAVYKPGRPASKGDQLKYKFTETCTCRVSGRSEKGKRSVYIQALDGQELVNVGKVTVLPNFKIPKIGSLVEIEYLYRHVHGALYQPVFLGVRDDLDSADQVSTIKIKEGIEIEEEDS